MHEELVKIQKEILEKHKEKLINANADSIQINAGIEIASISLDVTREFLERNNELLKAEIIRELKE